MERKNKNMFVDFENISFWASNIPKELEENISKANEEIDKSFDTEDQRKAYHLGVDNTISFLKQILDIATNRNNITFYYPNIDVTEEMTAHEFLGLISKLPEE